MQLKGQGGLQMDKEKDVVLEEEVKTDEVEETKEDKTYTEEELQKQLQSATDKRVTEALKTAKEKWEAEYNEKLEAEKSQAEELASMTAEERARAEFEKEKSEWLKEKSTFEKEKMKLETTKLLDAEGLPISFVDYVLTDSAEGVKENIKVFKEQWNKELDEAITERLKGKAPASGSLQHKDIVNMTKEEFGKLSYRERAKMLEIDPDIMGKLKN